MKNSCERITKRHSRLSVDIWTAQCEKCLKWRVIETQEEYEKLRAKIIEEPFICSKKLNTSCDDPADIDYNNSRLWLKDRPNLPKTPTGFERQIKVRSNFDQIDCYYITPTGKLLKSIIEVNKFLNENPEYKKDVNDSDFSFSTPKISKETVPSNKRSRNV